MNSDIERAAIVALLRTGRGSASEYAERIEAAGSAVAVLSDQLGQDDGQARLLADDPAPLLSRAQSELDNWAAQGYRVLTVLDAEYPQNLRGVHDRPPLIFVEGRLNPADVRAIAVVGARRATDGGISTAARLARGLATSGFVVVSGLAAGIDAAAHRAALAAGGRTLAVLGTGLVHSYPPENAALQRRIAAESAVVSQFWPETTPTRATFPVRNGLMSGLGLGTVIVEAAATSGTRVQARMALRHGRPVFLMRTLLAQAWAAELAERPGVHVVDGPEQVIETVERLNDTGALIE